MAVIDPQDIFMRAVAMSGERTYTDEGGNLAIDPNFDSAVLLNAQWLLANAESDKSKSSIVAKINRLHEGTKFMATIERVQGNKKDGRGYIFLSDTGSTKASADPFTGEELPEGWQVIRTEHVKSHDGEGDGPGWDVYRLARSLKDHRVLIFRYDEQFTSGGATKKMSLCIGIEDRGWASGRKPKNDDED